MGGWDTNERADFAGLQAARSPEGRFVLVINSIVPCIQEARVRHRLALMRRLQ